jgi:hypothetical protein
MTLSKKRKKSKKQSLEAQFPTLFLIQVPHGWTQILAIASHGLTFHAFLVKSIMETTTRHLKRIQWENVKYMYHTLRALHPTTSKTTDTLRIQPFRAEPLVTKQQIHMQ